MIASDGSPAGQSREVRRLREQLQQEQRRAKSLLELELFLRKLFGSWGTCRELAVIAGSFSAIPAGAYIILPTLGAHGDGIQVAILMSMMCITSILTLFVYKRLERKKLAPNRSAVKITPADWVGQSATNKSKSIEALQARLLALEEEALLDQATAMAANLTKRRAARL